MAKKLFRENVAQFSVDLTHAHDSTSTLIRDCNKDKGVLITQRMSDELHRILEALPKMHGPSTYDMSKKQFIGILQSFEIALKGLMGDCNDGGIWRIPSTENIDHLKCYKTYGKEFGGVFNGIPSKQVAQTGAVCVDCNRPIQRFV
jgi:hypothetical protein